MPNDAPAQKAGSTEHDDGVLFRLAAIARGLNRLLPPISWGAMSSFSPNISSIDFSEHDIERPDDRRDVSQHVPAA
jgi:hypothetical protein